MASGHKGRMPRLSLFFAKKTGFAPVRLEPQQVNQLVNRLPFPQAAATWVDFRRWWSNFSMKCTTPKVRPMEESHALLCFALICFNMFDLVEQSVWKAQKQTNSFFSASEHGWSWKNGTYRTNLYKLKGFWMHLDAGVTWRFGHENQETEAALPEAVHFGKHWKTDCCRPCRPSIHVDAHGGSGVWVTAGCGNKAAVCAANMLKLERSAMLKLCSSFFGFAMGSQA